MINVEAHVLHYTLSDGKNININCAKHTIPTSSSVRHAFEQTIVRSDAFKKRGTTTSACGFIGGGGGLSYVFPLPVAVSTGCTREVRLLICVLSLLLPMHETNKKEQAPHTGDIYYM